MPSSAASTGQVLRRAVGSGPDVFARVSARAAALRRIDHDGVLAPVRVSMDSDGTVIVELPRVPGTDLAELAQHRAPLSAGECAWLGAQVADALRAMHAAGLAHGDIAPANVLVRDGGITLLDTLSGGLDDELGTPGFQAPERSAGATQPGDVTSLGLLLRWCADDGCRGPISAWTEPMVIPDATARPTAALVHDALRDAAPTVPVAVPPSDVVSATRARIVERTQRAVAPRLPRRGTTAVRLGIVSGVLAVAGAVVLLVPPVVDAALAREAPRAEVSPSPTPAGAVAAPSAHADAWESPRDAASRLTDARVAALADSDAEALRALAAPGQLADELEVLASRLSAGSVSYEGLDVDVVAVAVTEEDDRRAEVTVSYRVTAHTVVDDGVTTVVEAFDQTVQMALVNAAAVGSAPRWLVESVTPSG
ncbi:protein kinase domain-containing protein [uncultured Demequina sp.]|uniref:protein kinase domain-containing protein n=1 Tax=uncultured Demequina sp. TaxID=693499 RepID=UPI0025EA1AFE|nr:protein kinase [uncultured Demequina sp.]